MAKVLSVFFVLLLAVVCFLSANSDSESHLVRRELAVSWSTHAAGGVIAVVAAAGMCALWLSGAAADRLVPGVIVLLGALSLGSQTWAVPLALGGVVSVVVYRHPRATHRDGSRSVNQPPPA